jgi:UDP-N-acetylmuramyl pentapeptide phosphotransferase/UDP-N-acetylglucosamine-1-phosphate transferase
MSLLWLPGTLWAVSLTHGLAGLGAGVHLIALVTFTLVVSFVVDADLSAGVRVLTLVYV